MTQKQQAAIKASDNRIAKALEFLNDCDRGRLLLHQLKPVLKTAGSLDSVNGKAFLCLMTEFVVNHRRDFIK